MLSFNWFVSECDCHVIDLFMLEISFCEDKPIPPVYLLIVQRDYFYQITQKKIWSLLIE